MSLFWRVRSTTSPKAGLPSEVGINWNLRIMSWLSGDITTGVGVEGLKGCTSLSSISDSTSWSTSRLSISIVSGGLVGVCI